MCKDKFFIVMIKYANIGLEHLIQGPDVALGHEIEYDILNAEGYPLAVIFLKDEISKANQIDVHAQEEPWHYFGQGHVERKLEKLTDSHPLELELPSHHGATPFMRLRNGGIDFATYKKSMQKKFLQTWEDIDDAASPLLNNFIIRYQQQKKNGKLQGKCRKEKDYTG